jgi:serine/threonine protein kinase
VLTNLTQKVRELLGGLPPLEPLEGLLEDPVVLEGLQKAYDGFAERVRTMRAQSADVVAPSGSQLKEIGGFKIIRELGRGGMGAVYLAQHEQEPPVVIKVPFSEFGTSAQYVEIFFREFQALSTVRHDNIVRVYRFGKDESYNVYYYVAEYVDGVTLKDFVEATPQITFTPAQVAAISMAVLRAIRFLRDRNVSHRDLKPGNIMFTQNGIVKLIDFGAAKIAGQSSQLTNAGVVMGTFDYMAPEAGKPGATLTETIGPERDIFAVGIMHYRLLKGHLPTDFGSGNEASLAFARFVDSRQRALKDLSGLDPLSKGLLLQITEREPEKRLVDFDEIECRLLQIIRAEGTAPAAGLETAEVLPSTEPPSDP